ncbi:MULTISPECIES: hypothetical protein [unclassified Halomonas]|uniref:hypothetical protein n=1 Tax=unclassified Halomonas TaxID=2609666 RepID=UPI00131DB52B|nr:MULTISPECIES: hypothetical protein [unclassified Halomonas]
MAEQQVRIFTLIDGHAQLDKVPEGIGGTRGTAAAVRRKSPAEQFTRRLAAFHQITT